MTLCFDPPRTIGRYRLQAVSVLESAAHPFKTTLAATASKRPFAVRIETETDTGWFTLDGTPLSDDLTTQLDRLRPGA